MGCSSWAASVPVRMMMLENVEEFMTWGPVIELENGRCKPCPERKGETFEAFIKVLTTGLEPDHPAWHEIDDMYEDGIIPRALYHKFVKGLGYKIEYKVLHACDYGAPTTRKRFFMVARNDGQPIKWPAKTHGPIGSGLKPFASAADIIDWSIPVKSIFNRKKPLAPKTMERIAKGLDKFVFSSNAPFIVPKNCVTPFSTECSKQPANELHKAHYVQNESDMTAFIAKHFTGVSGSDIEKPLHTVTTTDHNALVTSHMVKMRGTNIGHSTNDPVHTISAGGFHIGEVRAFLLKYYGTSYGESCNGPIGTVTTKDRFGLVTVKGEEYQIVDIGMRMLEPHELFAAQGFPADYKTSHNSEGKKLSKASQVARCGNAVCPPVAQALVESNIRSYELGKVA